MGRGRAAEAEARRSYRAGFIPLKKNDLILCDIMAKVGGSGERFALPLYGMYRVTALNVTRKGKNLP